MNLDLASTEDDIQVLLGPDGVCDVDDLEINVLRCQLPNKKPQPGNINGTVESGPTQDLPAVTVCLFTYLANFLSSFYYQKMSNLFIIIPLGMNL